jgi:hypothetical protein
LSPLSSLSDDESELVSSSEGEDEFDEDDNIEYDDNGSSIKRPTRRGTRNNDKISEQLPFSPKKTRRVILTVTDDEEDGTGATRRTTRSRQLRLKLTRVLHKEDEDYGESEIEIFSEDEYRPGTRRRRPGKDKSKTFKPKGPKPQYGIIRPIEDIDLDYFSDDEDRALRAHRMNCEKCHSEPANVQLSAWKKRKGRKKKQGSDEEEDEEERIERLGGWVQWYVFHLVSSP